MKLKTLIDEMKNDYLVLFGLVTAIGQLSFLGNLFSKGIKSTTLYLSCLGIFSLMIWFFIRHFQKIKSLPRYSSKRRTYKILSIIYAVLALLALLPAGYRWAYLYTTWFTKENTDPQSIETGHLFGGILSTAQAAPQSSALEVSMYLDPLRSSLQCIQTRNPTGTSEIAFNVSRCANYAISEERAGQIMLGHRISEGDPKRKELENKLKSAFRALEIISTYRGKHEPLLERGPEIMFFFTKEYEWKKKFLATGLIPNVEEWIRLKKEYPNEERGLREFFVNWIGFLDPLFRVSFTNNTDETIELTNIKYTATPGGITKAELIGAYETPRYRLLLRPGMHEDEFHPPIIVSPHSVEQIDLLIALHEPKPGALYGIKLEFSTKDERHKTTVPPFSVTFFGGKEAQR
jgi:hypothetical protein